MNEWTPMRSCLDEMVHIQMRSGRASRDACMCLAINDPPSHVTNTARGRGSPNRRKVLDALQPFIMRHERYAAQQRGRRNQPVRWISRKDIAELTGPLSNIVRQRLDAILREPSHLVEPC